MWKLLRVPLAAVLIAAGASQASAYPAWNTSATQDVPQAATLVGHKGRHASSPSWHYHRRYYPYYRYYPYHRHYRPYYTWDYCGWGGYGYWPSRCFGTGFYGGIYYSDRWDHPRHRHASRKQHVRWCKARYKTYNVKTDTFIGRGHKAYRCNSPYDGRR